MTCVCVCVCVTVTVCDVLPCVLFGCVCVCVFHLLPTLMHPEALTLPDALSPSHTLHLEATPPSILGTRRLLPLPLRGFSSSQTRRPEASPPPKLGTRRLLLLPDSAPGGFSSSQTRCLEASPPRFTWKLLLLQDSAPGDFSPFQTYPEASQSLRLGAWSLLPLPDLAPAGTRPPRLGTRRFSLPPRLGTWKYSLSQTRCPETSHPLTFGAWGTPRVLRLHPVCIGGVVCVCVLSLYCLC